MIFTCNGGNLLTEWSSEYNEDLKMKSASSGEKLSQKLKIYIGRNQLAQTRIEVMGFIR